MEWGGGKLAEEWDEKVKMCVLAAGGEGKGSVMGDELATEWEGEHDMPHLKGCRWGREWDIIGCGVWKWGRDEKEKDK